MNGSAEALGREVRAALDEARRRRAAFVALPAETPAGEVALAFDGLRRPLDGPRGTVGLYSAVHPDERVRELSEELERELSELETALELDREVYQRLARVRAEELAEDDARRLLEHALRDFRRAGVDRDEPERERLRALQRELVEIGQTFDRNIVQGGRSLLLEGGSAELAGLPEDYRAAHPPAAAGTVTLTTDPPDALPVLMYAESGELRRRMLHALQNRAVPQNLEVLPRLLALRHELAQRLGYPTWADFVTEDQMVRRPERVRAFLDEILERARPRAAAEYAELLAEKRKLEPGAARVEEWERLYFLERVKVAKLGFDSRSLRPYLACRAVQAGVLATAERLFGLEFRREPDGAAWHADVETYAVLERGAPVARFHLDLFPRAGKYKHAALFPIRRGLRGGVLPEAALVANFPRPSADDPGLLLHGQVTTFFHEFGHLLHALLGGRQRFLAFSGIETEGDFVEVPSQLFEEWAWDPRVLSSFARHHRTQEPIPPALVEDLRRAEEYGKGLYVQQQMLYARISLELYHEDPARLDVAARIARLRREITLFAPLEDGHFEASFGHLNGYTALYYTYMWSLVIAKDLFRAFAADPLDPVLAGAYRARVLAPGGSRDAADLVRDFLGRDYGLEAWEEWLVRG